MRFGTKTRAGHHDDGGTYLKETLGEERFRQIAQMYKRAGDNGRDLLTYLNIADILKLAVNERAVQLDESSILLMKEVRNWAAHVMFDLPGAKAVQNLALVKRECLRILDESKSLEISAGA